ncbi:DUF805 domain-containing protein [Sphingomonas sp. RT2P30]|uniref:DUF805 domain-containing protein n=1 Tax=Parasphingomonas halimpatiens TaxID=3096162 RepID=UPI002FC6A413
MLNDPSLEGVFGYAGRATRREFGVVALATLVVLVVSAALFLIGWNIWIGDAAFSNDLTEALLARSIILLDLIPVGACLATASRRLHDTGRTASWLMAILVPIIGFVLVLIYLSLPGQRGGNAYGPDPRSPNAAWLRRIFS